MSHTEAFTNLQRELQEGAYWQDRYDLNTINLIAPASPTPAKYCDGIPLRHNAIAEGLLEQRPYAGVEGFNRIERVAVQAARLLFGAQHANVQPHSVSQANQAAYQALLEPGDSVLAMRFDVGGHLTHGLRKNFSGTFYNFDFYGTDNEGIIDYEEVRQKARANNPRMIVCGASSYPRAIDFERLGAIAQESSAYLMADLSHPAGLIAAGRLPSPFPHCDVVTFTLDKTMLGPHGGIILTTEALKGKIDKAVHPGVQSSIPLRRLYAMGQCLIDASKPEFRDYIDRLVDNMKAFENVFSAYPDLLVTGGSDTNLMVLNTHKTFGLTGKAAEGLLESLTILTNRQVVPGEELKPYVASGIRLGTAWITARGYTEKECTQIAEIIVANLKDPTNQGLQEASRRQLAALLTVPREKDVWEGEQA